MLSSHEQSKNIPLHTAKLPIRVCGDSLCDRGFLFFMNYSTKLKDPRWQKKRLQILNRDKFTCKLCKDTKTTLQVHHLEYHGSNPWDTENKHLITLCKHCHSEVEYLKNTETNFCFKTISINKIEFDNQKRVMFIVHNSEFHQRIYDDNDGFIVGFILGGKNDDDIIALNKLLKKL